MTQQTALATDLAAHGRDALAAWSAAVGKVAAPDLERGTPCSEFVVADLVDHVQRSMLLLAESAGTPLDAPSGPARPEQTVPLAEAALTAWERRGIDGAVPVGSRTVPAAQAYAIVLMELAVHSWDLEQALGEAAPDVPGQLVEYLLEQAPLLITPDRRGRAFGAPVAVGTHARPLDRLVAFTGRTP
jgi:uncharacterized protein (TIGR03086 family)